MWRALVSRASLLGEWVRRASGVSEQRLQRLEACRALGVSPAAPPEAVRRAYYRLAKRFHPDLAGAAATGRFLQVQRAYETLRQHHYQQQAEPAWGGVTLEHGLRRRVLVRRRGAPAADCACAVGGHPLWALLATLSRFLRRPRC